ncbi:hypothetical protein RB195_001222 [Necator americanus]|uniref:Uncharacterized protein n=1 Tax=Necator americanus TaxID=51031 RepID=A0ABR1DEV3_NECAM
MPAVDPYCQQSKAASLSIRNLSYLDLRIGGLGNGYGEARLHEKEVAQMDSWLFWPMMWHNKEFYLEADMVYQPKTRGKHQHPASPSKAIAENRHRFLLISLSCSNDRY